MKVKYEGRIYEATESDSFGLDDLVMINNIVGVVDFIGGDLVVVIDETNTKQYLYYKEIKEIFILAVFIMNSTHRFVIEPKNVSHGKNNCFDNDRK